MKTCKIFILALLISLLCGGVVLASDYQGYPTVALLVDGKAVQSDVPPIIINDRTLVPLRVIAESFHATVTYNQQYNYAVITTATGNQADNLSTPVNGVYQGLPTVGVMVNGQVLTGDVPPVIFNDRTLVPVGVVAQALGCTVNYNDGIVTITSSNSSQTPSSGTIDDNLQAAVQADAPTPYGDLTGEADASNNFDSNVDSTLNYNDPNIDPGQ